MRSHVVWMQRFKLHCVSKHTRCIVCGNGGGLQPLQRCCTSFNGLLVGLQL